MCLSDSSLEVDTYFWNDPFHPPTAHLLATYRVIVGVEL